MTEVTVAAKVVDMPTVPPGGARIGLGAQDPLATTANCMQLFPF